MWLDLTLASGSDIFKLIFAIFLPPLGVFLEVGCTMHFWRACQLTSERCTYYLWLLPGKWLYIHPNMLTHVFFLPIRAFFTLYVNLLTQMYVFCNAAPASPIEDYTDTHRHFLALIIKLGYVRVLVNQLLLLMAHRHHTLRRCKVYMPDNSMQVLVNSRVSSWKLLRQSQVPRCLSNFARCPLIRAERWFL